jgi:hypothetical protein
MTAEGVESPQCGPGTIVGAGGHRGDGPGPGAAIRGAPIGETGLASTSFRLTEQCGNRASRHGLQPPKIGGRAKSQGRCRGCTSPRDRCLGPRRRRTSDHCLERAPGQANADAVLADHRRGRKGRLLVPLGALPGLPYHTQSIDLRTLDRHPDAAATSLIPALSCRSCRPNAPFAELTARVGRVAADPQLTQPTSVRDLRDLHGFRVTRMVPVAIFGAVTRVHIALLNAVH